MSVANYSYPASVFDHVAATYPEAAKILQAEIKGKAVDEKTEREAIDKLAKRALEDFVIKGTKVGRRIKVDTFLMKAFDLKTASYQLMNYEKVLKQMQEGMKREQKLNELAVDNEKVTKADEIRIKKTDFAIKVMNAITDKLNTQYKQKFTKLKPSRNPAFLVFSYVKEQIRAFEQNIQRQPQEKRNSPYVQKKYNDIKKVYDNLKLSGSEDKKLKTVLNASDKIEDMIKLFKNSLPKHFKKLPHQN
jgi:hypothetical protein